MIEGGAFGRCKDDARILALRWPGIGNLGWHILLLGMDLGEMNRM